MELLKPECGALRYALLVSERLAAEWIRRETT